VMAIALMVVGPERLPQIARDIGKTWRQIQGMSRMVSAQWQEELSAAAQLEAGKKDLREALMEPLKGAQADVERVLTSSAVTPIQTISNAQLAAASAPSTPPPVAESVPSDASAAAAPESAVESVPDPASVVPVNGTLEDPDTPPEAPVPTASSGEVEPVKQDTAPEPAVSTTTTSDGNPEHGNQ
jgi:Sec-independent protein translocase protein TatA